MTNIHMINELNNNFIFAANGKKKQLPDSVIDSKTDIGRIAGLYKRDDGKPFTIFGNPGEFSLRLLFGLFLSLFLLAWMVRGHFYLSPIIYLRRE